MEKPKRCKKGWTTRIFLGRDEHGKKITRRITMQDRGMLVLEAARQENEARTAEQGGTTLSHTYHEFYAEKEKVLSPSTLRAYNSMAKRLEKDYAPLWNKRMRAINKKDLQGLINGMIGDGRKQKTVYNYVLFISTLFSFRDMTMPRVSYPQKERPALNIPDSELVMKTVAAAKNTDLYIPVLLAAFGPLRRGEICALKKEDINENVVHVCRAMVETKNKEWIVKQPKTYSSDRFIVFPSEIINELNKTNFSDGRVIKQQNPNQITDQFRRLLKKNDLPHYRFHDLRHFCVSYLHSIGIPDIYIQQRSGHSSTAVLHSVYTHTLSDQSREQTEIILKNFSSMINSE